ncbi:AMP-binding protein [Nocardia higoensis]|uniref:AMP-binding protein n=2 Tax=Nocardia higoensis TaxID=228599 RepID=A0ABS0D6M1_9NOCA|nr:AMP-binding protein [Nocardia higoensis]MBF6354121.1 AMP-binding protein [Nocardia higoensis]
MPVGSESIALVFEERSYSRLELDELAAGLAADLALRGVRAGDRVALMSSNRPELVVAVLAIWRLGSAVVLISPAWKNDEVVHALATDCAVFGVPDAADGEAVIAAVHAGEPVTEEELVDLVGSRLATYKKPRRIVFVPEIPRLP